MKRSGIIALAFLLLLVLPFALEGLHSGDTDTFYHLACGRWMAEHHAVLDHEAFSFTIAGEPWTNYYWLFERAVYGAYEVAGYPGVIAVRAALVLAMAGAVFGLAWLTTAGSALEAFAGALVAMLLLLPRALNVRPHLFSYLFLALTLVVLERMRTRERALGLVLPLLCIAWASLHGVEYP
ncbi:MAG TPA: hypothetical protein VHF22_09750, partial [Planctomycetota bacterium]|nr:hypothetical protein [Planctomycetota bacterium]